jgi:hypothetical protein
MVSAGETISDSPEEVKNEIIFWPSKIQIKKIVRTQSKEATSNHSSKIYLHEKNVSSSAQSVGNGKLQVSRTVLICLRDQIVS